MKVDRIKFTGVEYQWLSNNINRTKIILAKAAEKDPNVLERKTYKTLVAVEHLFPLVKAEETQDSYEIMIARKERRILGDLATATLTIMNNNIIPEYQRRVQEGIGSDEKTRNDLTQHLLDAKVKTEVLKGLRKKLQ